MPDYVTRYLYKSLQAGEYPNYPDGVNDGTMMNLLWEIESAIIGNAK